MRLAGMAWWISRAVVGCAGVAALVPVALAPSVLGCGGSVDESSGSGGAGAGATSSSSSTGTGSTTGSSSTGSSTGSGASTTGVGGGAGEWRTLIEGEWSLPSGTEGYVCVVATMTEDVWVSAFRPIAPDGTHHTVLTKGAGGPDGVFPCDVGTNGQNMIYGSGVGTDETVMPEGVAMRLATGDKLLLNLHLYNTSGDTITGVSGTQIRVADPDDIEFEAEGTLAGTLNIVIPPHSQGSASGTCTLPSAVNVFAVGPHMHKLGTHMTVTAQRQGAPSVVMHDAPYTFEDQLGYPVSPQVALQAGDSVRVDCSYDNPTGNVVTFGDSSDQEMCFASLWVYPPPGVGLVCAD